MKLLAARIGAWALLLAGWIGLGALALRYAPTVASGFALVALWLLGLGLAAAVATRGDLPRWARAVALVAAAFGTSAALFGTVRGGGLAALLPALLGWAALTALASGVVRAARLAQRVAPQPPLWPAAWGALLAALLVGDLGDVTALALRMAVFVTALALLLALLQWLPPRPTMARPPGCRAGLFDCSLPAWPAGSWRDLAMWPTLLAGLAMLPMMAALPLMADWCRAEAPPGSTAGLLFSAQAMVALHLLAMFGPALLLRRTGVVWPVRRLAGVCAGLLALGAAAAFVLPPPWHLMALAAAHGAAWGLAWSAQLWAPARRAARGSSPLSAALGYALLTLAFGLVVEQAGARGVVAVHGLLGLAAAVAWLVAATLRPAAAEGPTGP